eukprot:3522010-Rhodomonas_salina.1
MSTAFGVAEAYDSTCAILMKVGPSRVTTSTSSCARSSSFSTYESDTSSLQSLKRNPLPVKAMSSARAIAFNGRLAKKRFMVSTSYTPRGNGMSSCCDWRVDNAACSARAPPRDLLGRG